MAAKNSQKEYVANSFYHLYNRGVEKRIIFNDSQDYNVFLSYLKEYLLPKDHIGLQKQLTDPAVRWVKKDEILKLLRMNNFEGNITLLAYCLMPNHFHLLIKQREENAIDSFMNSLSVRYAMYFNRKYKRVGSLFQGVYKAVRVLSDGQFLHLSRYIHRNHLSLQEVVLQNLKEQYSSYGDYIGARKTQWVKTEEILSYFSKTNPRLSYESFVHMSSELPIDVARLVLEED